MCPRFQIVRNVRVQNTAQSACIGAECPWRQLRRIHRLACPSGRRAPERLNPEVCNGASANRRSAGVQTLRLPIIFLKNSWCSRRKHPVRRSASNVTERRLRFARANAPIRATFTGVLNAHPCRVSPVWAEKEHMGIVRNRWVFGRALVSTLAFAVSVGLLALWETGRGTVLSAGADTGAPEFAYSGDNGPGFWGGTPGWEACAGTSRTQRQSPIDIDHIVCDRHLGPLALLLHETPLALTNNGHTIEEEYEPGSSLTVNGVVYGLSQFHFHTLSEHTGAGRHAAMELHAVFADPASDNKAVVGQQFVIGKTNRFIAELLTH